MKGSQTFRSQDSYKLWKKNTNTSFKNNIKLLTVVKRHVITYVQSAFLWRQHMH